MSHLIVNGVDKTLDHIKIKAIIKGLSEPLCGIGTYKDTLDLSTGTLTRYVKKLVLTGAESWLLSSGTFYTDQFTDYLRTPETSSMCSHYPANPNIDQASAAIYGVSFFKNAAYSYSRLYIRDNSFSTTDALKAFLSAQYALGTPVVVWYVLATPETEQIAVPSHLTGTVEGYLTQTGTPTPSNPIYPTANGEEESGGTYSIDTGEYIEAWEARDKNDHLLWGRADTFTGTNSISARCYGLPVKSWEIDGNSQQSGVPSPDNIIMPDFCGKLVGTDWTIPIISANQTVPVYLGQVSTVRKVKKCVLTGDEAWSYDAQYTRFIVTYTNFVSLGLRITPFMSNAFTSVHDGRQIANIPDNSVYSGARDYSTIYIKCSEFATLDAFKSWLSERYASGDPIIIWHILANEETAIVNEPLAKIGTYADELHSTDAGITIPTDDGNNTITVDTSLAPSKFEVNVHAKPIHYGFKIDKSVSDPSNAVIYTHDAVTMTPAGMDFANGVFDYGSWENVWFIKNARPVMLNFDGTEAYDLDPNDYSKKLDGTPSDIANSTKNMNAMIAFPTVWIKRTDDGSYNYIEISDRQLDSDFHAYAHEDANGAVKPYIYLPIYKGSMVDGKLRSISGVKPQSGTTAQQEVDAASALGTGWQIWDYTSKEMLCDLLTLISKSLDTQGKFGQGHSTGGSSASDFLDCGTLNNKGKFFGYSATTSQVKCFGMEALWAERWDRELGLILDAGVYEIKEHPTYNLTGEGYTAISTSVAPSPTADGYIKTEVSTQFGSLPTVVGGTASTYYCDYFYQNQSDIRVAVRGGTCGGGAGDGLGCVGVHHPASRSTWNIGASPVYK